MTTAPTAPAPIDDFLLAHAPAQPRPVEPRSRARDSLRQAIADLRSVPDVALENPWPWRGEEADIRYGFFRQFEALEEARGSVNAALRRSNEPVIRSSAGRPGQRHALGRSRRLTGIDDADLDRDPVNGEWTLRQTLAHIVSGQRAYAWGTTWWLARRDAPADDYPKRIPEDLIQKLPEESTEALGSVADIGRRLDDVVDASAAVLGALDDDALAVRARWSGIAVDVRFRLLRWSSHIREHTIQLEKTLGFIGRPTTEVERLLRLISGAYGRLEEDLFIRPLDDATTEALAIAEAVTAEVAAAASTVRAAAA